MKLNTLRNMHSDVKQFYIKFVSSSLLNLSKKSLDIFHLVLKKIYSKKYFSQELKSAKHILLCNCATLNDVFISTFIIPVLKKAYPHCKIGMMISEGSSAFAAECPYVDWTHECKHWLHDIDSRRKKIMQFIRFHVFHKRKVARSLRKIKYDYALNLSPNYRDMAGIFLKAKIPVRIGYDLAGYKYLLSHLVPWKFDRYLTHNYLALLKKIGIEETHLANFQSPYLSSLMLKVQRKVIEELPETFVLLHPCKANSKKGFSKEFWGELKDLFVSKERPVFFVGNGEDQKRWISEITADEKQNLGNQLNYLEFFQAINKASLIVSVDSLSVHVAAALKRPCIALYNHTSELDLWRPEGSQNIAFVKRDEALQKKTFRKDDSLIWVDHFSPKEILQAEERLLNVVVNSS